MILEGVTSALGSFNCHAAIFPCLFSFHLLPSPTFLPFSPPIQPLSSLLLFSSSLSQSSPLARPVLALPHTRRNAKTHNPLPRRNLGIRRPRRPQHSLQCSPPISNDRSSGHLLLRGSDRPDSLLPTWSRYRADE